MYNGIGLSTARGSGTNGYVQRNLALVRSFKDKVNYRTEEELQKLEAQSIRGPNAEIREHARKRELELRCAEMEDVMREHGYPDTEVAEKVQQFRTMLLAREAAGQRATLIQKDQFGKPIVRETHAVAEAQHEKNAKLKEAFGISEFFVEGSSFDPQRKVKEDAARQLKEAEEAEAREAERLKKKEAERKEAVEKEKARKSGGGSSAGGTAYGWVHTPSPSPERTGTTAATDTSKKDKKKEKKKKKKRSRDRSSSSEPPKKHKSKKRKRSRSPAKRTKHHKSKDKKKRDKSKKRARSSSTSGPESVSDSREVSSKAHREIRRRPSSPPAPSSQRGLSRGDPPVHKKSSSTSSQPHQQQQRRRHSSRSLSRSPVITPAEAEKARDPHKHSRRARSNSSSSSSNSSSKSSSDDDDDDSNRSRKKKKSRTGR